MFDPPGRAPVEEVVEEEEEEAPLLSHQVKRPSARRDQRRNEGQRQ